jgi:predicted nucleotidyltransferase
MITVRETAAGISSARASRLRRAQATLPRVVDLLVRKYRVRRIVLIGSLAERERFGFHSDIDLGVAGLADSRYFEAAGEVLQLAGEFDINLIPIESAAPAVAARIDKGEVVYDQG